ncbi:TauD/TfdA family dioxygenase [Algibacillus agarilyticus]|uniref:TauD/TfdA family dioxygenase n=1 Tax=Algibacillus agarilyticus TaxID=2234133 RepID=UPI000DD0426D|nr:TauD/TfdA family dioxygenase [Algibacillus agarilyticus]
MNKSIAFINDRSAWQPADLQADSSWRYYLTDVDISEIDFALIQFSQSGVTLNQITMENFVLPQLSQKLIAIRSAIENDLGLVVIKGLPVDNYTKEQLKILFLGIGCYLGHPLPQSLEGELLQEVYNKGENLYAQAGRGTNTSDQLPWHTDRSDIVSLLCINKSATGGESKLASLTNVYNKIKKERPDLAEVLCTDFYHGRAPFEADGLSAYYQLPVFTSHNDKFASRYLRRFIELSQDIEGVPSLTAIQIEALDYLDMRLNQDDVCFNLSFDKGDIQFINNFTICHSRNTYTDTTEYSRLLMRLWLAAYEGRNLAPEFEPLYGTTQGGVVRGGILL